MNSIDNNISQLNNTGKKIAATFGGDFEMKDKENPLLRYLVNGVLMFYISYGCIVSFISAFDIKYYGGMLFFVMVILSLLYSIMHITDKTHKIGYACILLTYIYIIIRGQTIIKSGFATIINETLQKIQDKLTLARIKQYTEYVDDKVLSVTLCLIVIGFVVLLVLNVLIAEYVNVIGTILLTAPLVTACYYFEEKPNTMAVIMYIAGIVGLIVMRLNSKITLFSTGNDYYVNSSSKDKRTATVNTVDKDGKVDVQFKEQKVYQYVVANKMHAHLLIVILIGSTTFAGIFSILMQNNYKNSMIVESLFKKSIDSAVASVVTDTGSGGSKSAATGGLGRGKLGKTSSIEYDNKTDLKVRFVPTTKGTLYLRGYIGSVYEENSWKTIGRAKDKKYQNLSKEITRIEGIKEDKRVNYSYNLLDSYVTGIFTVINTDANGEYAFMPYYSELNDKCMEARNDDEMYMNVNALSYEMRYHPTTDSIEEKIDKGDIFVGGALENDLDAYYEYMKRMYTDVPESCLSTVKAVAKSLGLNNKGTVINSDIDPMINKIKSYYEAGYIYTLSPGETPEGKDYVKHFIETKKGFCAHFTSAAVMLLRYAGVPARYVEGYAISEELIARGKTIDEDAAKYTNGFVDDNTRVIEVAVPDNKAHAWVEVYKKGFGWVPYEMTYYKEKESSAQAAATIQRERVDKIKKNVESAVRSLIIITIVLAALLIVGIIVGLIKSSMKRRYREEQFESSDKSLAIYYLYEYFCDVMKFFGIVRTNEMTVDEYCELVEQSGYVSKGSLDELALRVKKAAYSSEKILDFDLNKVKSLVENIVKLQYNSLGIKEKIRFKFIHNL